MNKSLSNYLPDVRPAVIFLVIAISINLSKANAEDGITDKEIVLGQTAAFTGPSSALGLSNWRGAQAYFNKINASGGIHGRKIRVIALDDGYQPDQAQENALTLFSKEKVFALFNTVGTPTMVKILPALQKLSTKDAFLFSNFTGAQPQREPPYAELVYNIRPSYREETEVLVDHLTKLGFKKIGLFIQDDSYGRSGADGTSRALIRRGLKVTAEATYTRGADENISMSEQVKILTEKGVDVVISVGSYRACAGFVRDARLGGFTGPIANVSFVGPTRFLDLVIRLEESAKKDISKNLLISLVVPPLSASLPLVLEYKTDMKKMNSTGPGGQLIKPDDLSEPNYISLEGFLNARAFVEILRTVKEPLTRRSFQNATIASKGFDVGLSERIKFSKGSHQALHTVYLGAAKKGEWVQLKSGEGSK